MILLVLLLVPLAGGASVLLFGGARRATPIALGAGALEIAVIARLVWRVHASGAVEAGRFLRADALTSVFLINIAFIFGLVLVYSSGYLHDVGEGRFSSPKWFYALCFFFLFTMAGVCVSANLGLLWIMMEATTLASALLVGFYNTRGAVEAGWKYLVVCTVGIAFGLFGTIVLYLAAVKAGLNPQAALDWAALADAAPRLGFDPHLLKLAFVFLAVGYGTKIGFVPMHSWLPDAHAEAPAPISALLSAVLLNCAMYALLRFDAIISPTAAGAFTHNLLLMFGVLSVVAAGLLIVVQRDLKRLLAYSSIEHMGIIAIGVGLGGPLGLYGALLHTLNHSAAKCLLFFVAGNVRQSFGTLRMDRIHGMARSAPQTAGALALGSVAIAGLPPFSLFISEFAILSEAFAQSRYGIAVVILAVLSVVFGGVVYRLLGMVYGESKEPAEEARLPLAQLAVMGVAAACLLVMGVYVPAGLSAFLHKAMAVLRS